MIEKKKKILVLEDEKPLSRVMDLKLSSLGFSVFVAPDGTKALEIFDSKKPDIVLLDLILPNMDGFSFLKEIRENRKSNVPVFVLSNLSQKEDKEKISELGISGYFIKSDTSINFITDEIKKII